VTRDWSRAVVDLTLEYGAEAERVQRALAGVSARLQADPALAEVLMGPAEVLSWNNNSDLGVQVRIMVKTLAGKHWLVGRVLRQYALEALEAEGLRPARPVTLRPASPQDGA
jgi:hypothetical protein